MNDYSIDTARNILEEARWAPSGDNTQPWKFEIVNGRHVVVRGYSTEEYCLYDEGGSMSAIAIGALLENINLSASRFGLGVTFAKRLDNIENLLIYDVYFEKTATTKNELAEYILARRTNRGILKRRAITSQQKNNLEKIVSHYFTVKWIEGKKRDQLARLLYKAGELRLTVPELLPLYRRIIEKNADTSLDRIPDKALGLDPLTLKMMHWAMKSDSRIKFMNTYLGGTIIPKIETDFMPAYFCGAHFAFTLEKYPSTLDEFVAVGRGLQRFWLEATRLGLQVQPEMAPLIFSQFRLNNKHFTVNKKAYAQADGVLKKLQDFIPVEKTVFLGRLGAGMPIPFRSHRQPLQVLIKT